MSVLPLYEKETTYLDIIDFLDSEGFQLYSLENGFANYHTGKLLQMDGIFVNKKYIGEKQQANLTIR
jgi:hypothetical protein